MRLVLCGVSAFFCFILKANAQEKRILNWQDFRTSISRARLGDPVQTGQFTIFQITHINKFLYKVEIQGSTFELQTPMPSELQALFRLTPAELEKAVTPAKAMEALKAAQNAQTIVNQQRTLTQQLVPQVPTSTIAPLLDQTTSELQQKQSQFVATLSSVSQAIFDLRKTRNQLISVAQLDLDHEGVLGRIADVRWPMPNVKGELLELKVLAREIDLLAKRANRQNQQLQTELQQQQSQLNSVIQQNQGGKKRTQSQVNAFNRATSQQAVIGTAQGTASQVGTSVEASASEILTAERLIDDEGLLSLINDIDFLYNELNNPANFTVTAPPVQVDGDMVEYEVKITPTVTRSLAPYRNPVNFKFTVPARGGLKVDFSVGPAVSFGRNSRDEQFYTIPGATSDSVILKKRSNRNSISPGIAALMHFYGRTGTQQAIGGVFGIGAGFQNISDVNLSLYFGPSIILGKQQKLMISGGLSYLRVERLKIDEFTNNGTYAADKIDLSEVTEKVFRPSAFLSLSYNLTTRVNNR